MAQISFPSILLEIADLAQCCVWVWRFAMMVYLIKVLQLSFALGTWLLTLLNQQQAITNDLAALNINDS